MNKHNGFALILTLLFVLFLTLFGFSLLLLAGSYYSSTRNLFEKQNARLACDQALQLLVDRHNLENTEPRLFYNASLWNGQRLAPFPWNDHEILATLQAAWSTTTSNSVKVTSRKGPFAAARHAEIRQRRLEDFALYCNATQELQTAALFDGPVYAEGGVVLNAPGTVFLDVVQATLSGNEGSCRRQTLQQLQYPEASQLLQNAGLAQKATAAGLRITGRHPQFWNGVRYEIDLDRLQLEMQPDKRWRLQYNGVLLGVLSELILWFDDTVSVSQRSVPPAFSSVKPPAPLYIASAGDVQIESNLHTIETAAHRHPLALIAGDAVHISNSCPTVLVVDAFVAAQGSDPQNAKEYGVLIDTTSGPMTEEEKNFIRARVLTSPFLLEDALKNAALETLSGNGRLVWFAAGLALAAPVYSADSTLQLHFQRSTESYSAIPPLPFVFLVPGSKSWQ